MARLTVRKVIAADPRELWKRFEGGSVAGRWFASAGGTRPAPPDPASPDDGWLERLRLGPISFEVSGAWAERRPPERRLCFLDGPWGLRIAEEARLERVASGTALALTLDYALGTGGWAERLDRFWLSAWVSRRLEKGLAGLQREYARPEDEAAQALGSMVHLERPEDRPWGLDQSGPPGPASPGLKRPERERP
ncbi:MAG: hypothetical protein ACE5IM_06485 [Nitrospinota bacterium]